MTGLDTFSWQRTIRNLDTPPAIKNVAGWLCSYANADGTHLHPGVVKLTAATGLTRDQVNEVLAAFRGAGLLTRTKRGGGKGSRLSDEYELTMPELCSESPARELERLLADEYELARKKRREREHARYESRNTNRGDRLGLTDTNRGTPPEEVSGGPDTNRGTRDTNRGITDTNRGGTTPPSRKPPTLDPPIRHSNDPLTVAEVEGSPGPSGQDRLDEHKAKAKANRQPGRAAQVAESARRVLGDRSRYATTRQEAQAVLAGYQSGTVQAAIVAVATHAMEARWFQPFHDLGAWFCYTAGRIDFTGNGRPAFGTCFAYLGPDRERFGREFAQYGTVIEPWSTAS